jgi:hypothetical protein
MGSLIETHAGWEDRIINILRRLAMVQTKVGALSAALVTASLQWVAWKDITRHDMALYLIEVGKIEAAKEVFSQMGPGYEKEKINSVLRKPLWRQVYDLFKKERVTR